MSVGPLEIEAETTLERFRKFLIVSTCRSFIPGEYLKDHSVFPERDETKGAIYVEASDKVTLKKMRDITFVRAREVLGVIYESKSGNTSLRWRQTRGRTGKIAGFASTNSLANLIAAGALTEDDLERIAGGQGHEDDAAGGIRTRDHWLGRPAS